MRRFKKWTNKPVTWGGYLKLCGIIYTVGMIVGVIYSLCLIQPRWLINIRKFVFNHFRKK